MALKLLMVYTFLLLELSAMRFVFSVKLYFVLLKVENRYRKNAS